MPLLSDFIDDHAVKISSGRCWDKITGGRGWDDWVTTRFFGDWIKKYHVRPRGHDAVVALALKTVYLSVTQILVRRDLFELTGMFESRWGSFSDFEWQMRAALATNTVHVPEYLATWGFIPGRHRNWSNILKLSGRAGFLIWQRVRLIFARTRFAGARRVAGTFEAL